MSNILRLFGIVVLAVLVFWVLNRALSGNHPAVAAAVKFTDAVASQDMARLDTVLDRSNAQVASAGSKVVSISFNQINVFKGAFSDRPAIKYSYLQLKAKQIPTDARVKMDDGDSASVPTSDGGYMYLRKVDGVWKVFYIDEPSKEDD